MGKTVVFMEDWGIDIKFTAKVNHLEADDFLSIHYGAKIRGHKKVIANKKAGLTLTHIPSGLALMTGIPDDHLRILKTLLNGPNIFWHLTKDQDLSLLPSSLGYQEFKAHCCSINLSFTEILKKFIYSYRNKVLSNNPTNIENYYALVYDFLKEATLSFGPVCAYTVCKMSDGISV